MAIVQFLQRSARPLVCFGLLGASTCSFGASASPQSAVPQITQVIDNQQRVTLKGNVRPMPRRAHDLGAVDVSMPASRVLLLLKRPAEQEAALRQFIADAHTPGTPSYHRWLTPAQLGAQFGPADSDVQAVEAWLQSQGFAVSKVSKAKTAIEFAGTAGQIESAFNTRIHSFQLDGVAHISNVVDPQIPAALAPVVAGISPLNDFRPKSMHTALSARIATPAPTSANPKAMAVRPAGSQPNYTNSDGTAFYVTPADAATIYNTPNPTLNKNHSGSLNLTGSGVNIGIAGDSNVDLSNVTNYRSLFGLPATPAPTVVIDGSDPGTGTDDEVEALLDLEVASAIAPGANLTLYTSQNTTFQFGLNLAIQRALDDNVISILNVSFGSCEAYLGQGGNLELFNFWQQAAAQGISVTVSSGDSGAAGCDNPNTETSATQGLEVSGFASTPYNIAVGGTDFNQNASNISTYWDATNSSIYGSAKGPIPEIPWNDSTSTIGSLSANVPTNPQNISGAGGGVSACLNATIDQNNNVTACPDSAQAPGFYAKPAWQSSFGSQNARQIPDVSLFAADGLHGSAWVLCASNLGSNNGADCTLDTQGSFGFVTVGGTSASAPAFAGALALVIQQLGGASVRLGQADYTLYPLSKQFPAAFHDVTTGNISVVCQGTPNTLGAQDCAANGFLSGYDAASGYDLATGLGSVDITQMVQNWSSIKFTPTTTALTVNGSASPVSIQQGAAVSVGVTVSSSGGTPTGDVALVGSAGTNTQSAAAVQGTTPSPSVLALSNGAATDSSYTFLPGGSYNLTANYGGDGTFAPSVSTPPISVTVSPEPSTLDLVIQAFSYPSRQGTSAASVPYGTYVSVAATPLSTAQFNSGQQPAYFQQATGTVTFSSTPAFAALNQMVNVNSNGMTEIPGQETLVYPPGTYSVSASYSGDPSFSASTAAAQTFTITKDDVSIASAAGTAAGSVVVEVDPAVGNLFTNGSLSLPTGTVALTNSSGATVGTGTLAVVNVQGGQAAQVTITASGAVANINYSGDNNYNTGSAAFSGGGSASFSLSAAPATLTVPSGGSNTTTINVTPSAGFTGTVNLTCAVTGGTTLQPTCALATPTVKISGTTAATDVLTVQTVSSGSAHRSVAKASDRTWYAAGGVALAGILLFGLPRRRRAWQSMLSLLLLFVAIGIVGCGGGSSGGGGGGTPAGTYTVTVTANSGSVTQTSAITVTVQ